MNNFAQEGDVLDFQIPSGGVTSGVPVQIGQMVVVATVTAAFAASTRFSALTRGTVERVAKVGSQAWTEGQVIYWDAETSRLTSVAGDNHEFGRAVDAVGSGAGETSSGRVKFDSMLSAADETT